MNSTDLYGLFRRDVSDTERPYLWADEDVWLYMDDAVKMFARLTGGIPDFTSEACEVSVSEGEPLVQLHPSIMRVMSARRRSDNREVEILNATDLGRIGSSDYGQLKSLLMDNTPGQAVALVIGMQRNIARVIHVPDANETLDLHVYRLPLVSITGEGQAFVDIEEMHHFHLLKWMKSQAYLKQDAETFDRTKAEESEQRFRMYCAEVKAENERYKHKNRTIAYGGY